MLVEVEVRYDPYSAARATIPALRNRSSVHLIVPAALGHSARRLERLGLGTFLSFRKDIRTAATVRSRHSAGPLSASQVGRKWAGSGQATFGIGSRQAVIQRSASRSLLSVEQKLRRWSNAWAASGSGTSTRTMTSGSGGMPDISQIHSARACKSAIASSIRAMTWAPSGVSSHIRRMLDIA